MVLMMVMIHIIRGSDSLMVYCITKSLVLVQAAGEAGPAPSTCQPVLGVCPGEVVGMASYPWRIFFPLLCITTSQPWASRGI